MQWLGVRIEEAEQVRNSIVIPKCWSIGPSIKIPDE